MVACFCRDLCEHFLKLQLTWISTVFSSMSGFEQFPILSEYLGRTFSLSYGIVTSMPDQKWLCLRTFGWCLLQGAEQEYDQKELTGAGPHNGETTTGLWLRSISRTVQHGPGLPLLLCCIPVQALPPHLLQPLPSRFPVILYLCFLVMLHRVHALVGELLTQYLRKEGKLWRTELNISWAGDPKKDLRTPLI